MGLLCSGNRRLTAAGPKDDLRKNLLIGNDQVPKLYASAIDQDLLRELTDLRSTIVKAAAPLIRHFDEASNCQDVSLANLAHYLILRHHDLRPLQRKLMWRGLSSLGRLESRVLPTLDAVIHAVAALCSQASPVTSPSRESFFAGEERLIEATNLLFGKPPRHRRCRIMVTLPTEAADGPEFVLQLAKRGMDCARINCAHDDRHAWEKMARYVRIASVQLDRPISVLMDIAGPKIRTEAVAVEQKKDKMTAGDALRLVAKGKPRLTPDVPFSASVSLPEMVTRLTVGDRIRYDDGKVQGVVESVEGSEAVIRIQYAKAGGTKLKPEKGVNLPDTALGLSPLTAKDEADLATVIQFADMIGYSFVSRPEDIDLLEAALARHGEGRRQMGLGTLGLVAKVEKPEAVKNLPDLIARAKARRPFGVMIARGDLAAEIGFERLAEIQEEILWICEAAAIPTIWATQVLEDLVKDGVPSRGEMTDAAMAARAECVMLNKGPAVGQAIELLNSLFGRMDEHVFKKTPTLRALKSW